MNKSRTFARPLTAEERQASERGRRSADAFTVPRAQVVRASAGGLGPAEIERVVGCAAQAPRNAIRALEANGLGCLVATSHARKDPGRVWDRGRDDDLKDRLHRRPRDFGTPTTLWTPAPVAQVCHEKGWAPGEARDHQPGPRVRREKTSPGRPIAQAEREPGWAIGFQDECGWTRLAQPDLSAWTTADPLRLDGNARDPEGGGPGALACDGVLRHDTGGVMVRLRDGRPVSATTEDVLDGVCRALAAEGRGVFVLVWDDAAWHVGKRVRGWIARRDRRVGRTKAGCRIRVCGLPVKAPWLNPIEPEWAHGARALVEPGRKLAGDEVRRRVCDYYGCPQQPTLPKPQT